MAFSKPETMGSVIQDIQPDIIINAAAYTIIDREVCHCGEKLNDHFHCDECGSTLEHLANK